MPTKRFEMLTQDKKWMISEVIMNEFLDSPSGEVSMSTVAAKAKISRTSLYGYFEDKEDMQHFALRVVMGSLLEYNKNQLIDHYGDLWLSMEDTMRYLVSKCKKAPFLAVQMFEEQQKKRGLLQEPGYEAYKNWVYDHVDKRRFKSLKKEQIDTLIEMCHLLLVSTILMAACSQQSEEEMVDEFKKQMDLLKTGFEEGVPM